MRLSSAGSSRGALLAGVAVVAGVVVVAWPLLLAVANSVASVISGEHMRRQADTFSVAEHFLGHPNFFYPRVYDTRGGPGIYGMEAPIVPYAISLGLRVFGREEWVGRVVVLALSVFGFAAMAYHLRRAAKAAGWALGAALLLSPMTLFYMRQSMPDMPMAALGVAGVALAYESRTRGPALSWVASLAFTLGVVTKYPLVFVYPAFVLASLPGGLLAFRAIRSRALPIILPLLVLGAWMLWSEHINEVFGHGRRYFHSMPELKQIASNLERFEPRRTAEKVLFAYSVVPESAPLLAAGLLVGLRYGRLEVSLIWYTWLAGSLLLLVTFSHKLHHHYYYAVLILPAFWYFLSLLVSDLFGWLSGWGQTGRAWTALLGGVTLWVLLAAPSRGVELLPRALCVVLVLGIALAQLWPSARASCLWRGGRARWLGGLLLLPLLVSPLQSSKSRFLNRCERLEKPARTKARRDELRQIVAEHTKPADLVVAISEQQQEPWPLLAAQRHGWADHARHVSRNHLRTPLAKGAQWLIIGRDGGRLSQGAIKRLPRSALVRRGRYFQLYSLPQIMAEKTFL